MPGGWQATEHGIKPCPHTIARPRFLKHRSAVRACISTFVLLLLITTASAQKLPTHVTIRSRFTGDKPIKYSITEIKDLIWAQGVPKGPATSNDGMTYCGKHEIQISQLSPEMQVTVLHELMHAWTNCANDSLTTHDAIYLFSYAVENMMFDNPDMAKYLAKKRR